MVAYVGPELIFKAYCPKFIDEIGQVYIGNKECGI
jgi:hypothetical protein